MFVLSFMMHLLSPYGELHKWNWILTRTTEAPPPTSSVHVGQRDSADLSLQTEHLPGTLQLAVSNILYGFDVNVLKTQREIREKFFNRRQNLASLVILLNWGRILPFLVRL